MTSAVRDTSLMAFLEVKENKIKLGEMQERVFNYIKNNYGCCDKEISIGLDTQINSITPRRNELIDLNFIQDLGTKKYNGRSVHCWGLK